MLAVAWPWRNEGRREDLSRRLATSLCAGIGGYAASAEVAGIHFAYRALRSTAAQARAWKPTKLPNGTLAVFHGYFDNSSEIAAALGTDHSDVARLYALAVERWGDKADLEIIGEYCAVIANPADRLLRLSRSPLRAPPLCYHHAEPLTAIASVPRALFAVGIEQRLNYTRVADSALLNFTDRESTWFEEVKRVPDGTIVELQAGKAPQARRYYDLLSLPDVHLGSDADYIRRAGELLDEGIRACLAGFQKPGVTLSGGLDSPQVAARALAARPSLSRLPTFTFHPEEGFDGIVEPWMFADDRPLVESFVAMHPRLEPHFTANEGYEHDHRWNEFFHLMGGAPSGICNMYVFHGLFEDAAKVGCDVLLVSDWGNDTFSNAGHWAYVEYLLTGQFRQLWLALSNASIDERSMAWRFIAKCLVPLLPSPLWRFVRNLAFPGRGTLIDKIQPLSREYRLQSGADQRLKKARVILERDEPRSRKHAQRLLLERGDFEVDEGYQAFEQLYGIAQRDPTAYRPFVEFCFGLPTRMFMRDGQTRWLARGMAEGMMPEEQRMNPRHGRWDSDWHLRMTRRRGEYLAEVDRLAGNERMSSMLDLPRIRAALEDWPEHTVTDRHIALAREMAVPRALLTARFINYVEGRNMR
jgi:asparagine synthase (glutamine-hydrolysing)